MKVSDIMTSPVISVASDTKVDAIAQIMVDNDISGVPVVDKNGHVVGIVTESDLVVRNAHIHFPAFLRVLDAQIYLEDTKSFEEELRRALAIVAADMMSSPPVMVDPDDDLQVAATLMVDKKVNPLPVVKDGRLVGIISRSDLVRLMANKGNAD